MLASLTRSKRFRLKRISILKCYSSEILHVNGNPKCHNTTLFMRNFLFCHSLCERLGSWERKRESRRVMEPSHFCIFMRKKHPNNKSTWSTAQRRSPTIGWQCCIIHHMHQNTNRTTVLWARDRKRVINLDDKFESQVIFIHSRKKWKRYDE